MPERESGTVFVMNPHHNVSNKRVAAFRALRLRRVADGERDSVGRLPTKWEKKDEEVSKADKSHDALQEKSLCRCSRKTMEGRVCRIRTICVSLALSDCLIVAAVFRRAALNENGAMAD